jgi:hypothetical protein
MQALKQKQTKPEASTVKVKLRWDVLLSDLSLFMSLMAARFIVWRTLRRQRQERVARRKQLRLVQGGNHQADKRVVTS